MIYTRAFKTLHARLAKDSADDAAAMLASVPFHREAPVCLDSAHILRPRGEDIPASKDMGALISSLCKRKGLGQPNAEDPGTIIPFTITTETPDHSGDSIIAQGGDVAWWESKGSFLWGHRAPDESFVLGSPMRVTKEEKRVDADILLMSERINPRAERVAKMFLEGHLSGVSVGILIKKWHAVEDRAGFFPWDILEWFLLETSATPIPANPEALSRFAAEHGEEGIKDMFEEVADNGDPLEPAVEQVKDALQDLSGKPVSVLPQTESKEQTHNRLLRGMHAMFAR